MTAITQENAGALRRDCLLSARPLSAGYRDRSGALASEDAIEVNLPELRMRSVAGMVAYLRRLAVDRVIIVVEDDDGVALVPVLKLVAALIPAREVALSMPNEPLSAVRRTEAVGCALGAALASGAAVVAAQRARRETSRLKSAPRFEPRPSSGRSLLFLNANLSLSLKAGGSIGHICGVVNGLQRSGYRVTAALVGKNPLIAEDVTALPLAPPGAFGLPWQSNFYRFDRLVVDQVAAFARKTPIDLVYQRLSAASYSGVVLSRRLNVPLVVEYNGSEAWIARHWGKPFHDQQLAEATEEAMLRHAHLLVTISDVLRQELLDKGIPAERIVTYPNCIEPAMFDPDRFSPAEIAALRRRWGIADDALVATFVGTFGRWHGAEVLARAARDLLEEHAAWAKGHKLHFLLVGDGLQLPEVRQILRAHHNGGHVTFTGLVPQADAPLYLAASDILVSPHVPNADGTRFFGSPTKLFEYMAMGKPILASDLEQIGEILRGSPHMRGIETADGSANTDAPALLCSPGDARDIVDGLKFLGERPEWRRQVGSNARRLALGNYTWDHHVAAILERCRALGLLDAGCNAG